MNKLNFLLLLGGCFLQCRGKEPFKPREGSIPFIVYYASRYRGVCVGTLVSRTTVLTAAVCVTSPTSLIPDRRPINVVTGSTYRHPRRGIRVQVIKILLPNLSHLPEENRGFLMQKCPALLLLKRSVPDVLAEIPLRAMNVDYMGEESLSLQEECVMAGWHFFYKGDKIYPVHKFLLQRNVRVQFMNIVKKSLFCDALALKLQKALSNYGFTFFLDNTATLCVRDSDRTAQPCHGMYGAPLICHGRVVAMQMAPDGQWTNCTGFSNIVHVLSNQFLRKFMTCVSRVNWAVLKKSMYDDAAEAYDYVPLLYDKIASGSSSSEEYDCDDKKIKP